MPNSPFASDPFFRYFFGDDDAFGSRDRRSLSLGSGVMISPDGYVITNSHVVGENVREITIALADKREIRGRVVGTDPATDIALLKIDVTQRARRALGRFEPAEGRRVGAGDWQPVPAEPDGHGRHRQRDRPHQRGLRRLRRFHPDRRGDQSRQFGRRAGQQPRRARRHQHRHLQRERRLPGHRVRGAEQSRAEGRRRLDEVRRGSARIDRLSEGREADRSARRRGPGADDERRHHLENDARLRDLRSGSASRRRHRRVQSTARGRPVAVFPAGRGRQGRDRRPRCKVLRDGRAWNSSCRSSRARPSTRLRR